MNLLFCYSEDNFKFQMAASANVSDLRLIDRVRLCEKFDQYGFQCKSATGKMWALQILSEGSH